MTHQPPCTQNEDTRPALRDSTTVRVIRAAPTGTLAKRISTHTRAESGCLSKLADPQLPPPLWVPRRKQHGAAAVNERHPCPSPPCGDLGWKHRRHKSQMISHADVIWPLNPSICLTEMSNWTSSGHLR